MQESIQKNVDMVVDKWKALTRTQKIQIVSIGLALLAALFLTIYFTTKPKWEVIAPNLDANTAYNLKTSLKDSNIESKVVQNETAIAVKEADIENAKEAIVMSGVISDGFKFEDAIKAMGMGTTADQKNMISNYEVESRLAGFIKGIDGIEDAKVKLSIPNENDFLLKSKQSASASVKLTTTRDLTSEQIEGVVSFITTSVLDLDKKNITVIDNKGNILYAGETEANGTVTAQYKLETQRKYDLERKVQQSLAQRYDYINVMSNLKLNSDKYIENTETYTSPLEDSEKGIPQQQSSEKSSYTNSSNADEPGLVTNGGDATQYPTGGEAGSEAKNEKLDTDFALNKKQTTTERLPGDIVVDESSMTVWCYKDRIYDQAELEENGALDGLTWLQFQQQIKDNPVALTVEQEVLQAVANGTGLDINKISILAAEVPVFIPKQIVNKSIDQYIMLSILVLLIALLAFGLIKKTAPAEVTEIEPELSVEEVLETFSKRQEYISPIDYDSESEVKKQIEKFVDERPEAVAQLLRNWLSSDWE